MTFARQGPLVAFGGIELERIGVWRRRTRPSEEIRTEITRASNASTRNRDGVMRDTANDVLRAWWREGVGYVARIEDNQTNSVLHSEDLTDAAWDKTVGTNGVTITADDATAPDGTTTADKVTPGGATDDGLEQTLTINDDDLEACGSWFLKNDGSAQVRLALHFRGGTTEISEYVEVNLNDGSVVGTSGGEVRSGVNKWDDDWWRPWIVVANNDTGNTTAALRLLPDTSGGSEVVHAWGAQLEGVD